MRNNQKHPTFFVKLAKSIESDPIENGPIENQYMP
jgi:hypothetical protein